MNTWDETKRRRNLQDHGIDFNDLEGFFSGDLLTREDTREAYGERRYQSIGLCLTVLHFSWCGLHAGKMATLPTLFLPERQ